MVAETLARTITRLVGKAEEYASDADLVRRFATTRDDTAFAILVRRHGPMVFGVCRRTLGHVHDAEDAFQATFLVLARRAHAVRANEVSRFLYGVAVRVALKARTRRMRHADRQQSLLVEPLAPASPEPVDWLPLLDAALSQMPERDRWPIVLCDLQGCSRSEAAAELDIAEGTLSSRLARSRAKLRARLMRLGVAPSLAAISVAVAPQPVPAGIVESTLAAQAPSAAIRQLAEGVMRAMFLTKAIKFSAFTVCAACLMSVGAMQMSGSGADPTPATKDVAKDPAPKDTLRAPAKSDSERFRGTWVVESSRVDGKPDDRRWVGEEMTFDGEKVKFSRFPGRQKFYKLDPGWDEKHIDFEFRDVPDGTETTTVVVPSIYRFENDKLHIVFGVLKLAERPESFTWSDSGSWTPFTHIILRRAPAKDRKEPTPEGQKALEGTWVMTAAEAHGERKTVAGSRLIFKENRFTLLPINGDLPAQGDYTVDTSTSPQHIDLQITAGNNTSVKGQLIRGIYSLDRGVLMLCLDETGKGRPTSFKDTDRVPVMYFIREGSETPLPPTVPSPRLRGLQKDYVKSLDRIVHLTETGLEKGIVSPLDAVGAASELASAQLELAESADQKQKVLEELTKRLKRYEAVVQAPGRRWKPLDVRRRTRGSRPAQSRDRAGEMEAGEVTLTPKPAWRSAPPAPASLRTALAAKEAKPQSPGSSRPR
jgi:RNA polymerase sigma factor (sigma-70 family)